MSNEPNTGERTVNLMSNPGDFVNVDNVKLDSLNGRYTVYGLNGEIYVSQAEHERRRE